MSKKIRWGLLGAGKILDRWMKGARQIENMEIVAVASPNQRTCSKDRRKVPEYRRR